MKIQANPSGTRSIEVTEKHLETIDKYALLRNLIDSNGIIDEAVLDKLRLNVRALLEGSEGSDRDLLDLCLDVLYNKNMKAFGLHELVLLYINWKNESQCQAIRNHTHSSPTSCRQRRRNVSCAGGHNLMSSFSLATPTWITLPSALPPWGVS